jgi:DNA-binding transcriptional MerR regulator
MDNAANVQNIYLVKDLAKITGHSVHTIKFYLKIGLIKEVGRSAGTGYRYFDDTTVGMLGKIRDMRKDHKPIKEIMYELL